MTCRRCWKSNEKTQCVGDFKLVHDPGHWGSRTPTTLVLGISKGNTQSNAYAHGPFDDVGFKGVRHRILEVFHSVGLLPYENPKQFERRFGESETDFAFASVVRCSLTGMDRKKGFHTAESPNVTPAFHPKSEGYEWVENCVDQHLVNLPAVTSRVLLLGNSDGYISGLKSIIIKKRGAIDPINDVAYLSKGVKFVHLTHPSRGNGHFGSFVRGEGTSGRKRDLAKAALVVPV